MACCHTYIAACLLLCRGGAEAASTAAAERAADAAEANLLENLPEKLDEFGRDENVELREEMSRRAQKRSAQYSTPPAQPQVCFSQTAQSAHPVYTGGFNGATVLKLHQFSLAALSWSAMCLMWVCETQVCVELADLVLALQMWCWMFCECHRKLK